MPGPFSGYKSGPRKLSEQEQTLRDRLSIRGEYPDDIITPEGVRVPRPPIFRKDTQVVGNELAGLLERLYKIAPEIRGRADIVSPGFTKGTLNQILTAITTKDLPSIALNSPDMTNMMGMTDPYRNSIFVSSVYPKDENFDTLAHEYQHLMGLRGKGIEGIDNQEQFEDYAGKTGNLAKSIFNSYKKER